MLERVVAETKKENKYIGKLSGEKKKQYNMKRRECIDRQGEKYILDQKINV